MNLQVVVGLEYNCVVMSSRCATILRCVRLKGEKNCM